MIEKKFLVLVCVLLASALSCAGENVETYAQKDDSTAFVRFFFQKQVVPLSNYRSVRFVFTDEIPAPYDVHEQLRAIAYHNKGVYKVFYDRRSRITHYEYFEKGALLMQVVFEYGREEDLQKQLQVLKYYAPDSFLLAIEKISYNNFGFPLQTERYVMPGYRKTQLY